jgi:uncharacterized iron-regulated membrane protein
MKVFFRRIHLYLGLSAGLVIITCCLTGAILVFQKELEQAFNKERYFVPSTGQKLSSDSLVSVVKKAYPKAKVNSIKLILIMNVAQKYQFPYLRKNKTKFHRYQNKK